MIPTLLRLLGVRREWSLLEKQEIAMIKSNEMLTDAELNAAMVDVGPRALIDMLERMDLPLGGLEDL